MIGRWLAHLGGGQEAILRQAPGDRSKFTTLGGVLLGTAALAAASAMFAVQDTLKLPLGVAIAVGVLWGLLILTLDRQLITTMTRRNGWRLNLLTALPRLILAILLGVVISEPLVLKIFEPEITVQLGDQRRNEIEAATKEIATNARFATLDAKQAELAKATDPLQDEEVVRLTPLVATAQQKVDQLNKLVGCEVVAAAGCVQQELGQGPQYEEDLRLLGEAKGQLTNYTRQRDDALAVARKRIADDLANPGSDLARLDKEVRDLVDARAALQAQADAGAEQNTGLSARLQALTDLGAGNQAVFLAHLALFGLFAAIEILPVVAKLLSMAGPPTLYDRLAVRREEDAYDHGDDAASYDRELAEIRNSVRLQLERDRADAQVEAGRRANEVLVGKQEQIATKAIDVWATVASAESDAALRRWYEEQTANGNNGRDWGHQRRGFPTTPSSSPPPEPPAQSNGHHRPERPVEDAAEPIYRSPHPAPLLDDDRTESTWTSEPGRF